MKVDTSISRETLSPRISRDSPPHKNSISASDPHIEWCYSIKVGKIASPSKGECGENSVDSVILSPTEPTECRPKPRVRYQRRNSAIASMLFPSTLAAMEYPAFRTSDTSSSDSILSIPTLQNSVLPMHLAEALEKAQEVVGHSLESSPSLQSDQVSKRMSKRASLPWSQKYQVTSSNREPSSPLLSSPDTNTVESRKRQRA